MEIHNIHTIVLCEWGVGHSPLIPTPHPYTLPLPLPPPPEKMGKKLKDEESGTKGTKMRARD